ncbi:MAG: DUF3164 family protein [Paracoccaceae bacterium]|jgi:hypothetical protein
MTEQIRNTGIIDVDGEPHMRDGKGRLQPLSTVRAQDVLQDEMVRKIISYAGDLSAQVARFKGHSFDDVGAFLELLAQDYGESRGGQKGNMTFLSYDGCQKVTVQVADHIDFGPELQIAKGLIDECLTDWSSDARPELRTIVERAFNTAKEGQINRAELFGLRRLAFDDERWIRAMKAIEDAIRVVGSKTYMRFYRRESAQDAWQPITIDMAKA